MSQVPQPAVKPSEDAVLVRLAGPQDASAVAWVLRQSFNEFQDRYTPQGFAATTPDEPCVRSRMREGPLWVALLGDAIVATASAVPRGDGSLYVRGMAVLPAARGRRIGELLLREIETYALTRGCARLSLSTTPFLSVAISLYERFGFQFVADGPNDLFGTPLFSMAKFLLQTDYYEENRREELCRKIMDTLASA